MKRAICVFFMLLPLASWAAGPREQSPDRSPPNAEQRFARLVETLPLTDSQQPAVRQILEEHHELMRELDREDAVESEALDAQLDTELAALLTSDQLQRWVAPNARRAPRADGRGPSPEGRKPLPRR